MIFGFFNRLSYRAKCTENIILSTGINRSNASKFVEWYKDDINYHYKKGHQPCGALVLVCLALLKRLSDIAKPEHIVILYAYSQGFIKAYPESEEARELSRLLTEVENSPLLKELQEFGIVSSNKVDLSESIPTRKAVQVTAKQALLFMAASLQLVETETLNKGYAKLYTNLYFAGAVGFLAGQNELDEEEYGCVVFTVMCRFGMSEKNAVIFADKLPELLQEDVAQCAFQAGRNTIADWFTEKDLNAPIGLFSLVNEWALLKV